MTDLAPLAPARPAHPHLEGLRDLARLVALLFGGAPELPDDPVRGLELGERQLRDIGYEPPPRPTPAGPDGRPYEARSGWPTDPLR